MFVSPNCAHTYKDMQKCISQVFGILYSFQLLAWFHWQFSQNSIFPSLVASYTCSAFFFFLAVLWCCFLSFAWYKFRVILFLKQQSTSCRIDFYCQKSTAFKAQPAWGRFAWRAEGGFSCYPNSAYNCTGQWKSQSQGQSQENNSPFLCSECKPEGSFTPLMT